ncbi:MAG: DNA-directed RNA polymerase subunit alpha C-terminal domain-containing protein [Rubrobacteraceae bacterium]
MKPSEHDLTVIETPIEELNFTDRTYNGLKREGMDDIGQLARATDGELANTRNLDAKNVEEIRIKLAEYEEDWR